MTDLTLTHETTPQTTPAAPAGEYPLSTLCLRLDVGGVALSWTLRGDDSDVASRLPRVLDYIKRLQAKLPTEAGSLVLGPSSVARDQGQGTKDDRRSRWTRDASAGGHDCEWHGPMKESTKAPGTWFCPKRMASGEFCKEKWPKRAGEQSA